jgi:hypothetical protein
VRARQDKLIERLVMQEPNSSSLMKKSAKVNMPSILSGLGKAKKVEFLFEMDNSYDVQKLDDEDKVPIAVSFLKDYALQWWTTRRSRNQSWWQT